MSFRMREINLQGSSFFVTGNGEHSMETQWELMIFTLLCTLAAGIFAGQGILVLFGKGGKLHMAALITEVVALVAGGFSAFLHLQHWNRIFNGFGQIQSGITHELIGIVVFGTAIIIVFVVLRKSEDKQTLPKWAGILALVMGIMLTYVTAASYDMSARPAWGTPMLYAYYFTEAFLLGAVGLWILSVITKSDDAYKGLAKSSAIAGALSVIAVILYGFVIAYVQYSDVGLYFFDPTDSTAPHFDASSIAMSILVGENALLFWLGSVGIGAAIPAILGLLSLLKDKINVAAIAGVAALCALGGGIAFRIIFYIVSATIWPFYTQ
jgi:anaerobic dimethyl sulfoxide reductase subunit C (anchor subunit)